MELRSVKGATENIMSEYVCIYSGKKLIEVELIKSQLEDAKIPCLVRTNDASGTMPHLNLERGIEVLVPKEKEADAKSVI